jgi:hypothetical protein
MDSSCADKDARNSNKSALVFGTGNILIAEAFSFTLALTPYKGIVNDNLSRYATSISAHLQKPVFIQKSWIAETGRSSHQ